MAKRDYKLWSYYDENDKWLFAADQKGRVKIGDLVVAEGKRYRVWYVEEGHGVHNARLELEHAV